MRYFENPNDANKVYGYDSQDPTQSDLLQTAVTGGWVEVTGGWPPTPTTAETLASYTAEIQKRLDDFARARGYDGILSACTYAASTVPKFAAEGQYAVAARDTTWAAAYAILAAVEAGTRPVPTLAALAAELPVLAWPV